MKYAFVVAEDINLGAGYVMAYLKEQGHDVKLFFDPLQFKRGYSQNKLLAKFFNMSRHNIKKIKSYNPDVCCFSCVTATYSWGLRMAKKIKEHVGCKIIFGGVHATLVPEEVKRHAFIDEVVVGCGIEHFGGKFEPDRLWPEREMFLDQLPPEHRRVQLFMTSFGCPFNCSFCGNEQLRKVKQFKQIRRKAEDCIAELQHLKERGMRYVLFVDDILTCDVGFMRRFMPLYARDIGLPFACFGHPKYLTDEVITLLKDAGCHTVWLGIQTGDERLRREILNRPELNKDIIDACKRVKDAGFKLIVDHIFGIPTETAMSQDISYNLYETIKPDIVNCYNLLYFPKAKIIDHALRVGMLIPSNVKQIERGEFMNYQIGTEQQSYYRQFAKSFVALPIGDHPWDLLPMWVIKVVVHLRAGRAFMLRAIIQNELFFTWRALCKRLFLG